MKKTVLLLCVIIFSCHSPDEEANAQDIKDNEELKTLYNEDQADRQSGQINWSLVSGRDSWRQTRIYQLLDSSLVRTSLDHYNAAMIFQHGRDSVASSMAVTLMRKAIALDSTIDKWLLAAAIDRDLMRRRQPQIYGTQYVRAGLNDPWKLYEIDTTKVSDEERKEYGVETLAEQREKVRIKNKKKLSSLLASGKKIDDIIKLCRQEDKAQSEYDLSESAINNLGYQLLEKKRDEEALKIFALNTELYPEGFNAYDSYGECLLMLGKKKEAIKAYTKSLELNPKNTNAEKVLAEITNK